MKLAWLPTLDARARWGLDRAQLDRFRSGEQLPWRLRFEAGLGILYRTIADSDLLTRASAMAYALVFSLIPLLTTSLAFFTAFPGLRDQRQRLLDLLFAQLLPSAVSDVRRYLEQFSDRAAAAGAISSLVFVVFVLLLFQSIESSFNNIWKVERPRTWSERLRALAVFLILGAMALAAFVELTGAASGLAARVDAPFIAQRVGLELISLAVAWAVFVVALRVLPNTGVRWGPALLGGVVVGTVWHLVKGAFTWYVQNVASYENIYGALGTVPAFFLWVWLTLLLLLIGGYIAFVAQNLRALVLMRATQGERPNAFYGVAVAAALGRAFRDGASPLTAHQIAERLQVAPYFVTEALMCLVRHGTVLAVPIDHEQRYAIAAPTEHLTVQDVVAKMTGEELIVAEREDESPLHRRLARLFAEARNREGNALARVTVAELEPDVPAPQPPDAIREDS